MNEEEEGLANLGLHSFLHKQKKTKHAYTHGHHTHIPENGSGEGQRVKKLKERNIMGQKVKTDLPLPTLYWVSRFLSLGSLWLYPA